MSAVSENLYVAAFLQTMEHQILIGLSFEFYFYGVIISPLFFLNCQKCDHSFYFCGHSEWWSCAGENYIKNGF